MVRRDLRKNQGKNQISKAITEDIEIVESIEVHAEEFDNFDVEISKEATNFNHQSSQADIFFVDIEMIRSMDCDQYIMQGKYCDAATQTRIFEQVKLVSVPSQKRVASVKCGPDQSTTFVDAKVGPDSNEPITIHRRFE